MILLFLLLFLVFPKDSFAHPGGLDSQGGHYCRKIEGCGGYKYEEYHCHTSSCTLPSETPPSQTSEPNSQPTQTPTSSITSPSSVSDSLELSEFMPNPKEGNEWVEVFNPGSTSVDISGYKIDDIEGGSSPFTIPQGTTIGGQNYLYFSFSARLNNEGDSVRLLNPDGQVIEEYSYKETTKGVSLAKDSQGNWQKTDTPTPGSKNIITTPVVAEEEKKSEKESKEVKEITKSNEKTGKTGKTTKQRLEEESILGSQATTPSLSLPATQEPESSPQAATYGLVKNRWFFIPIILAGLLIIAAGVRLWLKKRVE